jgi:hypothetical protein
VTEAELWGGDPSGQGLVAAVDPTDLKKVWQMGHDIVVQHGPNASIAVSRDLFAKACSPGADVFAVWCRASLLGHLAEHANLLPPELPEGIKNVVFNVAAKFPMKRMQLGVVYEGLPF